MVQEACVLPCGGPRGEGGHQDDGSIINYQIRMREESSGGPRGWENACNYKLKSSSQFLEFEEC